MADVDEDDRRFLRRLPRGRWHYTFMFADHARRLEQLGLAQTRDAGHDAVEVLVTPEGDRAAAQPAPRARGRR